MIAVDGSRIETQSLQHVLVLPRAPRVVKLRQRRRRSLSQLLPFSLGTRPVVTEIEISKDAARPSLRQRLVVAVGTRLVRMAHDQELLRGIVGGMFCNLI